MNNDPARIPVVVGVGQINDRPTDPMLGLDPVGLMAAALREADHDAGGGWLERIDSLAIVDQISFRAMNPLPDKLADTLGINPAHRFQTPAPMGDSPVMLLNEAANRIGAGQSTVCAVVGAEALRTAAQRAALAAGNAASDHNALRSRHDARATDIRARYGLVAPVDIYPLYENATRAAWGQTLAEGQAESGAIWAGFSAVAEAQPGAWLRKTRSAEEIMTPSLDNRPIAFPYTKLMVANSSVNQGAGFIVTSLATACAAGVAEDRLIYIGNGAAAHESDDVLARDGYAHSAGMQVSIETAMRINGLSVSDLDCVELYSCFPCVPKMARRVLGWPLDKPASVFGGLTFGGGPIGNYMSHAVVAMVQQLRHADSCLGGTTGLLFANGGFATHNHTLPLSNRRFAHAHFPRDFDFQPDADALRLAVPPLDPDYTGPGTIETYTVFYDRSGAARAGVVIARSPAGARFLATVAEDDTATIAYLTDGTTEPVGTPGIARPGPDRMVRWHIADAA
ncbi:acetyl-CoA acetyltransferase [Novosphingobium sp.]|uniref:acetyl-CoA acetyltransferase n=1 Tax=Novosphingobium sp. TaxID=1874826 RepID=UPI0025E008FD|nr:acetyl-CoA acetyltransferase [Novosphingobium sp.]